MFRVVIVQQECQGKNYMQIYDLIRETFIENPQKGRSVFLLVFYGRKISSITNSSSFWESSTYVLE